MMQKHYHQKLRIPTTVPTPGTTTGKVPTSPTVTSSCFDSFIRSRVVFGGGVLAHGLALGDEELRI